MLLIALVPFAPTKQKSWPFLLASFFGLNLATPI
jgi:hypothetical protein